MYAIDAIVAAQKPAPAPLLNHEARSRTQPPSPLGILLSVSAALAEILQRFDFKPLAAYGFAVTMVCQINAAILREQEKREARAAAAEEAAAEKAASRGSNPKKKRR